MTKHCYSIDRLNPKVANMGFKGGVVESNVISLLLDYYREI